MFGPTQGSERNCSEKTRTITDSSKLYSDKPQLLDGRPYLPEKEKKSLIGVGFGPNPEGFGFRLFYL